MNCWSCRFPIEGGGVQRVVTVGIHGRPVKATVFLHSECVDRLAGTGSLTTPPTLSWSDSILETLRACRSLSFGDWEVTQRVNIGGGRSEERAVVTGLSEYSARAFVYWYSATCRRFGKRSLSWRRGAP